MVASASRPLSPPTPTCAACHDGPVNGAGVGPPATIGCPRPLSGHERALPLKVKPRNMLIQFGQWSRPGLFTRTRMGRGRERAASSPACSRPPLPAASLPPPAATHGHGRRLFRGSAARRRLQDVVDGANGAVWHPATGQRPAPVAFHAHSRMRIRQRKRCRGRYPAIGWPGARVTGGRLPADPHRV